MHLPAHEASYLHVLRAVNQSRSLHTGDKASSALCLLFLSVDVDEFEEKSGLKQLLYSHGNAVKFLCGSSRLLFCGAKTTKPSESSGCE